MRALRMYRTLRRVSPEGERETLRRTPTAASKRSVARMLINRCGRMPFRPRIRRRRYSSRARWRRERRQRVGSWRSVDDGVVLALRRPSMNERSRTTSAICEVERVLVVQAHVRFGSSRNGYHRAVLAEQHPWIHAGPVHVAGAALGLSRGKARGVASRADGSVEARRGASADQ
jgi:hypothetical protein